MLICMAIKWSLCGLRPLWQGEFGARNCPERVKTGTFPCRICGGEVRTNPRRYAGFQKNVQLHTQLDIVIGGGGGISTQGSAEPRPFGRRKPNCWLACFRPHPPSRSFKSPILPNKKAHTSCGSMGLFVWWRRGDLNPRPSVRCLWLYMFSVVY